MARKKIIWSVRANRELRAILEYFIERNGSIAYSKKLLSKIDANIVAIQQNELIGRPTSNKKAHIVVIEKYLLVYQLYKNEVHILSIWDNRQNPERRDI